MRMSAFFARPFGSEWISATNASFLPVYRNVGSHTIDQCSAATDCYADLITCLQKFAAWQTNAGWRSGRNDVAPILSDLRLGTVLPIYDSAAGRIFLAYQERERSKSVLKFEL